MDNRYMVSGFGEDARELTPEEIMQAIAKDVILIQDASNMSGVALAFHEAIVAMKHATEYNDWKVRRHPYIRLFLDKLCSMAGQIMNWPFDEYSAAMKQAKEESALADKVKF
jgi:hypothetical protein